jgi:hypothetical protein
MKQKQMLKQSWHQKMNVPVSSLKEEKLRSEKNGSGLQFLKTFFIAACVLLGTAGLAKAQFQWGLNAGINASTMSALGNLGDDNALKIGFNSGLLARYRYNDWLAFKSGVAYQQKGEKMDEAITKNEIKTSLSYLVVPVTAEFSTGEKAGLKNGHRLFFATGPYFGYLLDSKQTVSGNTTNLKDLNDGDFGWNFELGFEFPVMKTSALQISLNYDMGFSDIAEGVNSQNKTASLNLGLLF